MLRLQSIHFNTDVDSGIIRISQLIYGICPGVSQATLFSRVFVVPARTQEGLVPSEIGAVYTFELCHVWHSLTLSRPDIVKQLPGPSLPKLMAQFRFAFRFSY